MQHVISTAYSLEHAPILNPEGEGGVFTLYPPDVTTSTSHAMLAPGKEIGTEVMLRVMPRSSGGSSYATIFVRTLPEGPTHTADVLVGTPQYRIYGEIYEDPMNPGFFHQRGSDSLLFPAMVPDRGPPENRGPLIPTTAILRWMGYYWALIWHSVDVELN